MEQCLNQAALGPCLWAPGLAVSLLCASCHPDLPSLYPFFRPCSWDVCGQLVFPVYLIVLMENTRLGQLIIPCNYLALYGCISFEKYILGSIPVK